MKFNKIKFIFLLLIFSISLFPQYDEKTIYLKQADNLTKRKQYEKANEIYESLLEKYPTDYRVVRKLINNYLIISKLDKAEYLLDKHQSIFPDIDQTTLRITILLRKGKPAKAFNLSKNFLKENSGKINYYRVISSIFEQNRQNENAIKILIKARNIAGDEYLFTRELAANYQNVKEYDKAIQEYLKHLEQNKSYFHYVVNRLKRILDDDEKQITAVEKYAENSENEQVIEVFALSLAYIGNFEKALLQYDLLDKNKLRNFADEQFAADNYDVAEKAYNQYIQKIREPNLIADARIKIAQIFILQNNLQEAEKILLQIYNDKELQKVKYRYRTKANRFCREILANIAIRQNESNELILNYLDEAKFFAFNLKEQKEVEFEIIHFLIMTDQLEPGKEKLRNLLYEEEQGSEIFKLGYYYSFLIAEMENDEAADSLLGELIINIPENELVNNALLFSLIITN
ncbi:MAG: tetratricopeptide repeat protein, partial [Candidatus Cloacimonetes bacterium]|nr:tetratricopeptide repeat protein [Candidatus Cloacimonadota bacterium]